MSDNVIEEEEHTGKVQGSKKVPKRFGELLFEDTLWRYHEGDKIFVVIFISIVVFNLIYYVLDDVLRGSSVLSIQFWLTPGLIFAAIYIIIFLWYILMANPRVRVYSNGVLPHKNEEQFISFKDFVALEEKEHPKQNYPYVYLRTKTDEIRFSRKGRFYRKEIRVNQFDTGTGILTDAYERYLEEHTKSKKKDRKKAGKGSKKAAGKDRKTSSKDSKKNMAGKDPETAGKSSKKTAGKSSKKTAGKDRETSIKGSKPAAGKDPKTAGKGTKTAGKGTKPAGKDAGSNSKDRQPDDGPTSAVVHTPE